MLKEMVDVRAAQGYSVWKGETFVINGKQGGGEGVIANAGGDAWGAGLGAQCTHAHMHTTQ